MPTADCNGQTLFYEEHGEGEPLLCVMGLSANTMAWALQVQAFGAEHRTVIFDNRDAGRSSMAERDYEITDMAADTLALADHLGLDEFHLLGVSMGGAIAQEVALAAPERVKTLTLAMTFAHGGAWARKLSEVWGARRMKQSWEEFVDELLLLNLSEAFFENEGAVEFLRNATLADPNPQPPEAFVRQLAASGRHRADVERIATPTHVIGGEQDILVPVWKSKELSELIPGANLERAVEFNELVLGFLR